MKQGSRSDIKAVKRKADEGASNAELWNDDFGFMLRNHRAIRRYKRVCSKPRDFEMKIITLVGDTGTGKTKWAYDNYPGLYSVPPPKNSGTYFDDYDNHDVVLCDEMHAGWFTHTFLLRLTDRYQLNVPVHGGSVNFRPHVMIFTSNHAVSDWYDQDKFPWIGGPLQRRLTTGTSRVYTVTEGGVLTLTEGEEPFIGPLNLI